MMGNEEIRKILDCLYSLDTPSIKLGLENLNILLDKIGNPQKSLKCIHVAGTNGKGSVCAMIQCMLMEAGFKVGLYTSPHLKNFNERIRIGDKEITDREIVDCFTRIKPHVTSQSFFEITTAIAFLYFHEKNLDFVVLEAGLGGRLDATNVVTPLVSVITNISLEHTERLGKNIERIAFEKAGIIKQNVPIVTGASGIALQVIRKIAKNKNAPLYISKDCNKTKFFGAIKFLGMNGNFQKDNAKIALTAISVIDRFYTPISFEHAKKGIINARWKGRMEYISKNLLVDCAHNPAGFEMLKKELNLIKSKKKIKNFIFVMGAQSNKNIAKMLKIMLPIIWQVIFTSSKNPKAMCPKGLLEIYKKISPRENFFVINDPKEALEYAKKSAGKDDFIVIAGSIYMIGEIL